MKTNTQTITITEEEKKNNTAERNEIETVTRDMDAIMGRTPSTTTPVTTTTPPTSITTPSTETGTITSTVPTSPETIAAIERYKAEQEREKATKMYYDSKPKRTPKQTYNENNNNNNEKDNTDTNDADTKILEKIIQNSKERATKLTEAAYELREVADRHGQSAIQIDNIPRGPFNGLRNMIGGGAALYLIIRRPRTFSSLIKPTSSNTVNVNMNLPTENRDELAVVLREIYRDIKRWLNFVGNAGGFLIIIKILRRK